MIISHRYKYLFVELPHTASTAISQELCENYAGEPVLHKHAHYYEFCETATTQEKTFFVFSGIRNPLDEIVSIYFKLKADHKGVFSNPKYWRTNGGHITQKELRKFSFIQRNNADFATYFRRFYKVPYDNWSRLSHHEFDFIIRFENLQDDFAQVLELLGIAQIRPIPVVNKTVEKRSDALMYYTPEIIDRARWVFGPFLERWEYKFPTEWGDKPSPRLSQMLFYVLAPIRKHLLWGPSPYAQTGRKLRSACRGYF